VSAQTAGSQRFLCADPNGFPGRRHRRCWAEAASWWKQFITGCVL